LGLKAVGSRPVPPWVRIPPCPVNFYPKGIGALRARVSAFSYTPSACCRQVKATGDMSMQQTEDALLQELSELEGKEEPRLQQKRAGVRNAIEQVKATLKALRSIRKSPADNPPGIERIKTFFTSVGNAKQTVRAIADATGLNDKSVHRLIHATY